MLVSDISCCLTSYCEILETVILLTLTILWVEKGSFAWFFNWSHLGYLIGSWTWRAQYDCRMALIVVEEVFPVHKGQSCRFFKA